MLFCCWTVAWLCVKSICVSFIVCPHFVSGFSALVHFNRRLLFASVVVAHFSYRVGVFFSSKRRQQHHNPTFMIRYGPGSNADMCTSYLVPLLHPNCKWTAALLLLPAKEENFCSLVMPINTGIKKIALTNRHLSTNTQYNCWPYLFNQESKMTYCALL